VWIRPLPSSIECLNQILSQLVPRKCPVEKDVQESQTTSTSPRMLWYREEWSTFVWRRFCRMRKNVALKVGRRCTVNTFLLWAVLFITKRIQKEKRNARMLICIFFKWLENWFFLIWRNTYEQWWNHAAFVFFLYTLGLDFSNRCMLNLHPFSLVYVVGK